MKLKIDEYLVNKGFYKSIDEAKRIIMSGVVFVNNIRVDKAGALISEKDTVEIHNTSLKYVSRGGLKLEKAVNDFHIDLNNVNALDIGCSTGGFTDCLIKNGAAKVYAVDVGYGQLDWKIRNDKRVIVLERTNARYLTKDIIKDEIDFTTIDTSFISLKIIVPAIVKLMKNTGKIVALIKPQFEAKREDVGKKGVVRDPEVHKNVLYDIVRFMESINLSILDLSYSPITGPEGNIEFLIYLSIENNGITFDYDKIEKAINGSHAEFHQ